MAIQQETGGFALSSAISVMTESVASFWKPVLVAAPLIGTALSLASGTQAQTSGSATPSTSASATGPVAPIAAPEAARTGRPKIKTKTPMDTSRVANPPVAAEPVAPIDTPEAARTGRPKERDKTPTNDSVANPPATPEPVDQPTERRRKGPKERDDDLSTRTGRPKERDPTPTNDRVANPLPAPEAERTGRGAKPKGDVDHGRTSSTPLIIGALGAATILALVVSSGNDRPASP
jgi:hypothetical protein